MHTAMWYCCGWDEVFWTTSLEGGVYLLWQLWTYTRQTRLGHLLRWGLHCWPQLRKSDQRETSNRCRWTESLCLYLSLSLRLELSILSAWQCYGTPRRTWNSSLLSSHRYPWKWRRTPRMSAGRSRIRMSQALVSPYPQTWGGLVLHFYSPQDLRPRSKKD